MATDPYGTDVLLTDDGDFAVTPAGQLATITGPMNCAQALISRLRTHPGELPLQPEYGSALSKTIIGTKASDPTLVVSILNSELRRIFESDRRFLKAENITASSDPAYPARSSVYVELVLAGGDRLIAGDLAGDPALTAFESQPELAGSLSPDEISDLAGSNPDDDLDALPELDEDLEGTSGDFYVPDPVEG